MLVLRKGVETMRKILLVSLLIAAIAAPTAAASVRGDYLEARTADVYTGACVAMGEVNLEGQEAIMAWKINEGEYEGVDLSGLTVVAVVKANATLGDPFANPHPARSVIVVDDKADDDQRLALENFAREMGGKLLENVLDVKAASVEAEFGGEAGHASVKVGDLVELKTRALTHEDHLCGNEFIYYPPLTEVANATPAYTLANAYQGDDFNTTWSCPLKRSAFVGEFVR